MNEIPGINFSVFGNPTTTPFVNANDIRSAVVQTIHQRQQLASSNKAGPKLRADRATNAHLNILSDLLSGQPHVRSDLTTGGSYSINIANRRIHIPTFNEYTADVVVAGVRYAPLQHAVWDAQNKKTVVIGAEESLKRTLQDLMDRGLKDFSYHEQATILAREMNKWRKNNLQHMRFGPHGSGGALSYYLSHQVSVSDQNHPAVILAKRVEGLMGQAISTATHHGMAERLVGGAAGVGITQSASYVREALAHQLAIGLILFEKDSPIRSAGVKALRLRGFDAFSGDREIGSAGRLIASDLPPEAYVAVPGSQLAKGLHHRRAMMAIPTNTVYSIRNRGAKLRGLKKSNVRTTRAIMSQFDTAARDVASQSYGQMGAKLPGSMAQLDTPIKTMVLRAKAGLSPDESKIANQVMFLMFGDSTAHPTSPEMTKLAARLNRFDTLRLEHGGSGAYAKARLHPLLEKALETEGVGGTILFDKPLTFEDLGGERVSARGRGKWKVKQRAFVGGSVTSTGTQKLTRAGKAVEQELMPWQRIVGLRSGPGVTQVLVENFRDQAAQEGTPLLVGPTKRMSLGVGVKGLRGVDLVTASGKHGVDLARPDALVEHVVSLVARKGGRAGMEDVARVLGGEVKDYRGELYIKYGEKGERLFSNADNGELDLKRAREVILAAQRHGVDIGPRDATTREALLDDIFNKGQVGRIGELYHGVALGAAREKNFAERYGEEGRRLLGGRKLTDLVEGAIINNTVALRAGQPTRGAFGRVSLRMRDLRMHAVGVSALGGEDVLSMYRKNTVMKRALARSGAADDGVVKSARRYGKMWRNTVEVPTGLHSYMDAVVAAAEGRVEQLGSSDQYEIIDVAEYRKRYGSGLNRVHRRSELKDLRGTPFVQEVDGQLVPTRKTLVVKMTGEGVIPFERDLGTQGARTSHIVIPSGEAIGLRPNELVNFTKTRGRGLKSGFGRMAVRMHGAVTGGSEIGAFRASGATSLIAGEGLLGRGGKIHRGGSKVKASFSGTLVADANLNVGEIGLSFSNTREMLRRQGFKGKDLDAKVLSISEGREDFYTHFKTEPMRSSSHLTVAKVRVMDDEHVVVGRGGKVKVASDQAIRINPLWSPIRQRDFDYDPGYLFNLARKHGRGVVGEYGHEQNALRSMWRAQSAEYDAIGEVARTLVASAQTDKAMASMDIKTAELMSQARKIAKEMIGRPIVENHLTTELAIAQTMATGPELMTPLANVRWRTRAQLLEDVALGKSIDSMFNRGADAAGEGITKAMEVLRNDRKAVSWLHTLAETSEYQFLKKAGQEKILQSLGGEHGFANTPDTFFSALTAQLDVGAYVPGTKEANEVIERIQEPIMNLIGQAEGHNAEVWTKLATQAGVSTEEAQKEISRRMATSFQAVAYAEQQGFMSSWQAAMTGTGGKGTALAGGSINNYLKIVEGRSPELAGRVVENAWGWGGPLAGMASAAKAAGDASLGVEPHGMGQFGKQFAGEGKDLLKKLWDSKWGKPALGAAALIAATSAAISVFGSDSSGPSGAPMPPPPMVDGVGPDRDLDFDSGAHDNFARIQRVNQVRTHMQVTGQASGRMNLRGLADGALGRMGRSPMHSGHFIEDRHGIMDRTRLEAEINDRMGAEF